jgi:anti-anti-sigma factor
MVREHEWAFSRRLARSAGGRRPWWVSHPALRASGPALEWLATGPRTVVAVSGDLDHVTTPQLEAFVAQQPLAGCAVLEIDLGGVPSIGSAGFSVLLGVRRWALQRGIEMRIRGAQPSVWRAFEVTGLAAVFTPASDPAAPPVQDLALF